MIPIILTWILRLLVGGVLLVTGIGKLLDVPGFEKILETYQAFPHTMLPFLAVGFVLAELKVAEMILSSRWRGGALASTALHLIFTMGTAATWYRGINIPNCGCFGVFWARPLTLQTVIEDLVMFLLSAFLYFLGRH